eukprot:m.104995 g.104995  ORF g.104995 m.104995 type:complete len:368 (+) comp12627_c1_seq1:267-1370(+)
MNVATSFWVSVPQRPQRGLPNQLKLLSSKYLNRVTGREFLASHVPAWACDTFTGVDGTQHQFTAQLFKAITVEDEESGCGLVDIHLTGDDLRSSEHYLGDGNLVIVIKPTPSQLPPLPAAAAAIYWPAELTVSSFSFQNDRGSPSTPSRSSAAFSSPHGNRSPSSPCDSEDANSVNSDCSDGELKQSSCKPSTIGAARIAILKGTLGTDVRGTQLTYPSKEVREVWSEKVETLLSLQYRPVATLAVRLDPLPILRSPLHLCLPSRPVEFLDLEFVRHQVEGERFLERVYRSLCARRVAIVGYPWRVRLADLHSKQAHGAHHAENLTSSRRSAVDAGLPKNLIKHKTDAQKTVFRRKVARPFEIRSER